MANPADVNPVRKGVTAPSQHLLGSLTDLWRNYRKALTRCQKKFSENSVHDLRVETRRLLSETELLTAVVPNDHFQELRRELKRRLDSFDDLRDTQVQVAYLENMLDRFPELKALYKRLQRRERRLIKRVANKVQRSKGAGLGKSIACLIEELHALAEDSRAQVDQLMVLTKAVDEAYSEALRLRRQIDPADLKTIHRLRVAFKKFRYIMEALQPVLPGVEKSQIEEMQAYQTMMGNIQDIEVLRAYIDKLVAKKKIEQKPLRPFRAELARRRAALVKEYLESAGRLNQFWKQPRRMQPRKQNRRDRSG